MKTSHVRLDVCQPSLTLGRDSRVAQSCSARISSHSRVPLGTLVRDRCVQLMAPRARAGGPADVHLPPRVASVQSPRQVCRQKSLGLLALTLSGQASIQFLFPLRFPSPIDRSCSTSSLKAFYLILGDCHHCPFLLPLRLMLVSPDVSPLRKSTRLAPRCVRRPASLSVPWLRLRRSSICH